MTGAETHLQAIVSIQHVISDVTRRKALCIKNGLMENDFKGVNQSMEEDIKLMNDEIEKRLATNPNLVVTNTRYVELLQRNEKRKYIQSELTQIRATNCRDKSQEAD